MNTSPPIDNQKANKVRTNLLLYINAEWTKQQKKPQMLINSFSPSKITKSYDIYEINITNPREYGGTVSSIQNNNMLQMIKSPEWNEPCLSRFNSGDIEDFQLNKHLLSQNKLKQNNDITHNNSKKKNFGYKKTMSEVMKHGFKEIRKIARELKVNRSGTSIKRKSPDKKDSRKKHLSLFKKHQTDAGNKPRAKHCSNKHLNNDHDNENNYQIYERRFLSFKAKTAFPISSSVDESENTDTTPNDNNYLIIKNAKKRENTSHNILSLQYRPFQVNKNQTSPKLKMRKNASKSPFRNPKSHNKSLAFGIDGQIITLQGCSPTY